MSQPDLTFDNPSAVTFEVSAETRTIRGLAVPYGVVGDNGAGKFRFTKGSLSWGKVKFLDGHDWSKVLGISELEETDEGLMLTAKVARGARGDDFLALAEMGAYDGLSIGLGSDAQFKKGRDGVQDAVKATIREVSGTPIPAFESASITSVAASAAPNKENNMDENETVEVETPVSLSADDIRRIFTEEIAKGAKPDDKRPVVPAGRPDGATFEVREEAMYRFDGTKAASGHDLSADMIAGLTGDGAAYARVLSFMSEEFANPKRLEFVATGDVSSVNPAQYRPDMFKDEEPAQPSPMYDTFYAGGLSSVTPFFYSKLDAYSGLLGAHTEGTPPSAGSFSTDTGATITPTAVSGRVFITREVADQGGNPQVSGLIYQKFARVFRESLETKAAEVLHAGLASFADLNDDIGDADDGATLGGKLKQGLVNLQFTSNGSRFRKFFAAKGIYAELAAAEDLNGRPLYPILAASNADGTSANRLGNINVAGILLEPTWSTEIEYSGSADDTSFYVDPMAVKVWNSGLTRFDKVGETAAGWNVDVFAYVASHLYDATGVRKVAYANDPGSM